MHLWRAERTNPQPAEGRNKSGQGLSHLEKIYWTRMNLHGTPRPGREVASTLLKSGV